VHRQGTKKPMKPPGSVLQSRTSLGISGRRNLLGTLRN
jgi:hypothetical protein